MVQIREISAAETYALRQAVLWPDQPIDFVKVPDDESGLHYGAFLDERLVAVISLFRQNGEARFRKFATRPDLQGKGIGTALLNHVLAESRRLGARLIWCDARLSAAGFYRRFGMQPEGEVFCKGPIPYSKYVLDLYPQR
ncbi:GNAT family N-acetyltransferase [Arsenicibacter rosenii]|uniref:GNAT family N-acetyltransferase n=1 Tax=Arsenicibacter rosenii TaxID=1750698 RepID=A0A1S2VKD0_9BACT|nr:GNAT family N-acetyltransferase [Arsenicibacter rosenii]OIN59204.1 GNAT family N-acetyltransferase [Arsenicibacter rosenii]